MSSHNSVCYNQRQNLYEGFPDTSVGKEYACNAGDLSSIPGSERPAGERIGYSLQYKNTEAQEGFPGGLDGKESTCKMGDLSSIPGSERSPGEGHRNPLQYSCLENPMERGG